MSYLTESLRKAVRPHLASDETVLTAIYAEHTVLQAGHRSLWLTKVTQVHHPTRAFVLTPRRALIVDDPNDPATSTAERGYLFASCTLDRVMLFELRSHLLDCALTLVLAAPNGPERVTIEYSGVSERAFLAAVACMRALLDGQPLPPYTRPDETYAQERTDAQKGWHAGLSGLGMKQENTVIQYLVSGERVLEWLSVPEVDQSAWWQRLGIGAHERPSAVLVRTDRQILLLKETRRVVRGQMTYGSEAWLMPKARLHTASIVSGQREPEVRLTLEHVGVTEVVHLPVLSEIAERALALVLSHFSTRDDK